MIYNEELKSHEKIGKKKASIVKPQLYYQIKETYVWEKTV